MSHFEQEMLCQDMHEYQPQHNYKHCTVSRYSIMSHKISSYKPPACSLPLWPTVFPHNSLLRHTEFSVHKGGDHFEE
jgi:hypothetical protein